MCDGKDIQLIIVIVNYNSYIHTKECVEALLKQTYQKFLIYIIDNLSEKEEQRGIAALRGERVLLHFSEYNRGFSGGNNLGIRYAMEQNIPYILLLNNDTACEEDFLEKLTAKAKIHSDCVICPKILNYYERNKIMYGGGNITRHKGAVTIYGVGKDISCCGEDRRISFAHGCCMLLPLSLVTEVGFMPEHYFLYFEDTAYSKQIADAGFSILYCGNVEIFHKESVSTLKYSDNYQYYFIRNRLLFIKEHIDSPFQIPAYLYTLLYIIKKLVSGKFKFKNCMDAIRDFHDKKTGVKEIP